MLAGRAFPRPCMWDLDNMQIKKASSAPVASACTDEVCPRRHIRMLRCLLTSLLGAENTKHCKCHLLTTNSAYQG